MISKKELLAYIISKKGCIHPFIISRIIAYSELKWYSKYSKWLTDFKYIGFLKVFYIDGLKEIIEEDNCFQKINDCIKYVCRVPELNPDIKMFIDNVLAELSSLSIDQLNNKVVSHKFYDRLLNKR